MQYVKHLNYINPPTSTGVLAYEDFTFRLNTNRTLPLDSLVFNCSIKNVNFNFRDNTNKVAGKLGLGNGCHSLVHQLGPLINSLPDNPAYFSDLQGLNLAAHCAGRLSPQGNSSGEYVIDIGSAYSLVTSRAYTVLKGALENYFGSFVGYGHIRGGRDEFDFCYERGRREGYNRLPNLTFHFKSFAAGWPSPDLVIRPEGLFALGESIAGKEYFCLAMLSTPIQEGSLTFIGACQQINQRFVYDTNSGKLFLGQENYARTG
ncbi:Aspartic peptidase domain containing protein [Trema orientale]|uniref:Aspartic peptidase domain containing protein n=1 Tax=Trema orientale TaxID=63057 RepID=A0A2P5FFS0_TREOI|nr:Aspartic peptidase domain containing protein [Trema orientale]